MELSAPDRQLVSTPRGWASSLFQKSFMSLMLLILWCGHHATLCLSLLFPLWRERCSTCLSHGDGTVWVLGNRWMGHGFIPSQPSDIRTCRPLALALHHSDDAGDAGDAILTIRRMASLRPFMEVVSPVSLIATGCFTRGPLLVFPAISHRGSRHFHELYHCEAFARLASSSSSCCFTTFAT
jgi:hypothetical protein